MTRDLDELQTTVFRATANEPPTRRVAAADLAALLGVPAAEATKELPRSRALGEVASRRAATPARAAASVLERVTKAEVLRPGRMASTAVAALALIAAVGVAVAAPRTAAIASSTSRELPNKASVAPQPATTRLAHSPEHEADAEAARNLAVSDAQPAPTPAGAVASSSSADVRAAADALARHELASAASRYRELATTRPTEPVFAVIASVLERRLRAQCQARREAGEPPCPS